MKRGGGAAGGRAHRHARTKVVRSSLFAAPTSRTDVLIAAALAILTLAIYGQVLTHQFINFDDDLYLWDNPTVIEGLTFKGLGWAFTTFQAANWHPVTWISHMIDCQIFGLRAGGHLFVSALIHITNTLLLFFFLNRVTKARWSSALVAAVFALHPLHVESVAWASERKDTLSTFFGLLCLFAYVRYVEKPVWKRYLLVAIWLVIGLMTKPMLVSWPFGLLLLDYWPLRRIEWQVADSVSSFAKRWWPLIREKLPLFALVAASMVITYIAQLREGAVAGLIAAPLLWRLANAIVSYAKYVLLSFWPTGLAIIYPSSDQIAPVWQWAGALIFITAITVLVFVNARVRPYLITGWLWFLITLVPVIGFVQVGSQAMADRYTYVPSIGLFIAIIFGLADMVAERRISNVAIAPGAVAAILLLAFLTYAQVNRWRDSETLFRYALSVTTDNRVVQNNLGSALGRQGRHADAIPHFAEALRLKPDYLDALGNMGVALFSLGRGADAIGYYEQAIRVKPDSAKMHLELGQALATVGRNDDALREVQGAVDLSPDDFKGRLTFGQMLTRQGRYPDAISQLNEALRLDPNSAEVHNDLGIALVMSGHPQESVAHFSTAIRLKPDLTVAQDNLKRAQKELEAAQK